MAVDRERELDSLALEVAQRLELLGKVSLATPFKSIRRVIVQYPLGTSLRLVISSEFRKRGYRISVLRVVDDENSKLTYAENYTIGDVPASGADLEPLVAHVKETLERLATLPVPPR